MPATVADIIQAMETIAPHQLAQDWDNIGLHVGRTDWAVRTVWIALDPSPDIVTAACRKKVDLLITHHPLIYKPLHSIDFRTPVGSSIHMAAKHHLAIFTAHTNLDIAVDGLNDVLARRIGLKNLQPLAKAREPDIYRYEVDPSVKFEDKVGLGRVGELSERLDLKSLVLKIKKSFRLAAVRVAGDLTMPVNKVAVCTGSGSSLIRNFFDSGSQVYISGDFRYHEAKEILAANLGLIDIGHFASEHLIIEVLAERLTSILADTGLVVAVNAYRLEKDPFVIL